MAALATPAPANANGVNSSTDTSQVTAKIAREISISADDPQGMVLYHYAPGQTTGTVTVTSTISAWDVSVRDQQSSNPGQMDRSSGTGPLTLGDPLYYQNQAGQLVAVTGSNALVKSGALVDTFDVPLQQSLIPGEDVLAGDGYQVTVTYSVVASDVPVVVDTAPVNLTAPSLNEEQAEGPSPNGGKWRVGNDAVATPGTWSGDPTPTITYQMMRCTDNQSTGSCQPISGQTSSRYRITNADEGQWLRVRVTGSNRVAGVDAYSSASEVYNGGPEFTASPALYGSTRNGQVAAAYSGVAVGEPSPTYALQWQVSDDGNSGWSDISGADGSNYTPLLNQVGKFLRVKVTASNNKGSAVDYSPATEITAGGFKPSNTVAPTLSGTERQGYALSAGTGSWLSDPSPNYSYQWQRSSNGASGWVDISGAVSSTYTLSADDVGAYLRVRVNASNSYGEAVQPAYSSATGQIAAATVPAVSAAPTVTGNRIETYNLTAATQGAFTGLPTPSFSGYQWLRCETLATADGSCQVIAGATSSLYTLVAADIGKDVRVRTAATNVAGTGYGYSASGDQLVEEYNILTNTAAPAISAVTAGKFKVGYQLSTTNGSWSGRPASITYGRQWQRCDTATGSDCVSIAGATSSTYTLQKADENKYLRSLITATNGRSESAPSSRQLIAPADAPVNIAVPTISGNGRVGTALTRSSTGTWTGDPTPTLASQWQRSSDAGGTWSDIAGATGSSYTVQNADYGKLLRLKVTASNADSSASAFSASVEGSAVAPSALSAPVLSGTGYVDAVHTVTSGSWAGDPAPSLAYQWKRCDDQGACINIGSGAATYTSTVADMGSQLKVTVSATNLVSTATQDSNAIAVTGVPPTNTSAPSVSGTARFGYTLAAADGTWSGSPTPALTRQWQSSSDGTSWNDIAGATASTYTLTQNEVGLYVRVKVTATNAAAQSNEVSTATGQVADAVAVANSSAPTISGSARTGVTLSSTDGVWTGDPSPTRTARQWQRCDGVDTGCSNISGAAGASYTLTTSDVDKYVRLQVTYSNVKGSLSATSSNVGPVTNSVVNNTPPSISGTSRYGYTLSVNVGSWSFQSSLSRQWQRCDSAGENCSGISGATFNTYALQQADIGSTIRVAVTGSNSTDSLSVTSNPTTVIAAAISPAFNDPAVTLTGTTSSSTALAGSTLSGTASLSAGDPAPSLAYRWQSSTDGTNWSDISGATSSSYTTSRSQLNLYVRLRAIATNAATPSSATGYSAAIQLDQTTPLFSVNPSISGVFRVGETLTASQGTVDGSPTPTVTGKWQRADTLNGTYTDIAGATTTTYVALDGDLGKFIRYRATASNAAGTTVANTAGKQISAAISNTTLPSVSGTMQTGSTLTTTDGVWAGTSPEYAYQWYRCSASGAGIVSEGVPSGCSAIQDATASTYVLQAADEGSFIRSQVVASNSSSSVSAFSPAASLMAAAELAATEYQVCSSGGTSCYPNFVSQGPDGAMWVSNRDSNQLARVSTSDGTVSLYGTGLAAGTKPAKLVKAGDGRLWMANGSSTAPSVAAFTISGGSISAANYSGAVSDIALGVQGQVAFAHQAGALNQTLGQFTFAGAKTYWSNNSDAYLVARSNDDTILNWAGVASSNNRIQRSNLNAWSYMTNLPAAANAMITGYDDGVYYLLPSRNSLLRANWSGNTTSEITGFSASGGLQSLVNTPDGALWMVARTNNRLVRYSTTGADAGTKTEYAIPGLTSVSGSIGLNQLAYGPDGKMWVTATSTGRVIKVTIPVGPSVETAPSATVSPAISGTASNGNTLTASNGTWSGWPRPYSYTYQWQRSTDGGSNWSDIASATGSTYLLGSEDIGMQVRVIVTATSEKGSGTATSSATQVQGIAPVNTVTPVVSGTATDGQTLTGTAGTWTGTPTPVLSYQWVSCTDNSSTASCSNISGATSLTYTISGQSNRFIRLKVTGSNVAASVSAFSAATSQVPAAPVNTATPTLTAPSVTQGATVSVSSGTWTGTPTPTYTYQWQRCDAAGSNCVNISGATSSSYVLTSDDAGVTVRARVTATNSEGSASATSSATATVSQYSAYASTVVADSPLGFYQLDDASGSSTAAPTTGSTSLGVFGTTSLRQTGAGAGSFAASFPGDGGSYVGQGSGLGSQTGTWSMEAWVKPSSLSQVGNSNQIMSNSQFGRVSVRMGKCPDSTGTAAGACIKVLFDGRSWVDSNWSFPDTTSWHHVVVTRDGTTTRIYVDGVQRNTSSAAPFYNNLYTTIGGGFAGAIDDVAFYTTALSATRVTAHYNAR